MNCGYLNIVKYISEKEPSINNLIRALKAKGSVELQLKQAEEKSKKKKEGK